MTPLSIILGIIAFFIIRKQTLKVWAQMDKSKDKHE